MLKQMLLFLRSMKTMAILMLIFAVSIGTATFIENDFGTQTAKAVVYNARWFEGLLFLLGVNLFLNILNFKMYRKEKFLLFLFHVSFFVILIGAAITRYFGYEGMMHIREGAVQNTMLSSQSYLRFVFDESGSKSEHAEAIYLSKITKNDQQYDVTVGSHRFSAKILDYIPDAVEKIEPVSAGGEAIVNLMITGGMSGPQQVMLHEGEFFEGSGFVIDFNSNKSFEAPTIALHVKGENAVMSHPMNLGYMKMDDRSSGEVNASNESPLELRTLYSVGQSSFVVREFAPHAKVALVSRGSVGGPMMNTMSEDALRLELRIDGESSEVLVKGSKGDVGTPSSATLAGVKVDVSYGAKVIELPFALKLVDFELARYPGSNSPSSYASDVELIDKEQGIQMPFRIYMNHVLDHRGYRFFQSSYDRDELGTVLSVNNDPGTLPTYIGYLMLAIGMFGSLFMKGGRFARLSKKAKDAAMQAGTAAVILGALLLPQPSMAENLNPIIARALSFDRDHAEKFAQLMVQDSQGRMKPMDTLATEIVAKINRSDSILGLTPNQIVLGMMLAPDAWREINMIRTANKEVNKIIGVDENAKFSSFSQFFEFPSEMAGYKLNSAVEEAIRKAPGKRDKFDKAVLQVDERVNVAYMVYTGALLRIWPVPEDANNKWMATIEALQNLQMGDAEMIRLMAVNYFNAIEKAIESKNWSEADKAVETIIEHQKRVGAGVYPSENKIAIEMLYNKLNIFERLWPFFFLIGFVLLILSFARIINPKVKIALVTKMTMGLLVLFFVALTAGLAMRWYISGHAPWSDGYESLIYISWATVLAGFIFSKNSPITLAATGILAGLTLFVAHLSWMDPQVTNLVPVLKSYWLSIHVSMITGSYGFLGLGALLGFISLILFIIKNERNEKQISASIKELNAINEMSLMIGLATLTVGNFLGGVWANESWGRYWGWDPKETWALVTILIYAVVVHIRFIKSLYSDFAYSVISLLAFTSVIMTYFGVNYYLAGMHSYAKGDPVPIPDFVPVTYTIIFIIIILAFRKRRLA